MNKKSVLEALAGWANDLNCSLEEAHTKALTYASIVQLYEQKNALLDACKKAKIDIDYVMRAYPNICGQACRGEAITSINEVLSMTKGV